MLAAGTRIGSYEILSPLGAGGMGEVYRARDARLKRDVAIKLLPGVVAGDPERLARFQREAEILASLNHPNIATIHGVEAHAGHHALVLELVDGPTLADLIAEHAHATPAGTRALPIADALAIARQIALALESAHEAGIVHRDLKPANVKVRPDGTVKVLDFGLAKALDAEAAGADAGDAANSPTMLSPVEGSRNAAGTAMGVLLGTAAYMAPEQARGRAIDARADIWAFGCVLFEMLTGRPVFAGESITDTLAAVLRGDPAWETLPPDTPASVRRLLRRCLVRDHRDRLPDIRVARLEIDDAVEPVTDAVSAAPVPPARSRLTAIGAAALALATVALIVVAPIAVRHVRETPVDWPTVRLELAAPDGHQPPEFAQVSPDGRFVVFMTAAREGSRTPRLWLRALDALEARELPGTDGAIMGFWSPDSRAIGFFTRDALRRVDVSGGPASTVASGIQGGFGGAWGPDGTIVYGSPGGLWRVPASGGEPIAVSSVDGPAGALVQGLPQFLPDGRRFLFTELRGPGSDGTSTDVWLGSLDGSDPVRVLENSLGASYALPGYLVYARQGTLMAQPFDARRGAVHGDPVALMVGDATGAPFVQISVSTNGVLVYRSLASGAVSAGTLVWVSPQGHETPLPPPLTMGRVEYPRLSPDGQRVAFVTDGDIWVADLAGRPPIRLTFDGSRSPAFSPLWTPDGQSLVYEQSATGPTAGLWSLPADGSSSTPTRASPEGHYHPHGWSADGRDLVAVRLDGALDDIVALPFGEPGEVRPILATPALEGGAGASVSPDGRWLAYAADPTGRQEIWVRPYPGPGAPVRISPNGGVAPVWSRDGRTLFYRNATRVLSVAVEGGPSFRFAPPELLFESADYVRGGQPPTYDVAPDGRFLMLKRAPGSDAAAQPTVVILNWVAELERRIGR